MIKAMHIVHTLERAQDNLKSIFLAGPCLREKQTLWRQQVVEMLASNGYDGQVFCPELPIGGNPEWTYSRQVGWELEHLSRADVIMFWIPRSDEMPGFTTNIEFGEWLKSGKIVIGAPEAAHKTQYMEERCSRLGIVWHTTLEACVEATLQRLAKQEAGKIFFTADTHFDQVRTLELSRRPMATVAEMTWEIIARWNRVVGHNDVVYHLGDFGAPKYISHLQGRKIYILPGNYDTDAVIDNLKRDPRVVIIFSSHVVKLDCGNVGLVHAPEEATAPELFYLFGHIHQLQIVKKNGLNVGSDCHHFTPIDAAGVAFYKTAIEKHYDHNVFLEQLGRKP